MVDNTLSPIISVSGKHKVLKELVRAQVLSKLEKRLDRNHCYIRQNNSLTVPRKLRSFIRLGCMYGNPCHHICFPVPSDCQPGCQYSEV